MEDNIIKCFAFLPKRMSNGQLIWLKYYNKKVEWNCSFFLYDYKVLEKFI